MVKIYKTTIHRAKGKWCHFEKKDFERHGLLDYYWRRVEDIDVNELKEKIVDILKKEGFEFFDVIDTKYITHFGKLAEFAVNYWHIH
jgi:uncharacterized protein YdcH (DUF465 family)